MSILWEQLTLCNQEPPEVVPQGNKEQGRLGNGFAVLCPVNASHDAAVRRNTDLIKERFEAGLAFSAVVESPPVTSSGDESNPDAVPVPQALSAALNSIVDNVRPSDVLIVYVCSSTPIDPNVVLSTLQRYPTLVSIAMILFDCPALVAVSVHAVTAPDRRAVVMPALLMPREHFEGHLTLKLLHAMLDLGDAGRLPSLVNLAALVNDVAMLIQGQARIASVPWSTAPLPSTAKATFIACMSQSISRDDATNAIVVPDGRTVGGNLKRVIPNAKIRLVIEKSQSLVITFTPDKAPSITVERAQIMLDEACASLGNIEPPIVSYVSHDGRVHCSVNPEQTYVVDSMLNGSLQLLDPDTGAPMRWLYLGVSFKYEVVTAYREFLLMDAIARLHVASAPSEPWRQVTVEDLGLAVVVAPPQAASHATGAAPRGTTEQPAAAAAAAALTTTRSATPPQPAAGAVQAQPSTVAAAAPAPQQQPPQQSQLPATAATTQPAPAPVPTPAPAAPPAAALGSDMLAMIRMMIDDKVREAIATERHEAQARLAEQQRLHDARIRELESEIAKRSQQQTEAQSKFEQKVTTELAEIRSKAADHGLVERALNDIHAQQTTLKQQSTQLVAATQGRLDDMEKEVRSMRGDFGAVVTAVDAHDALLQQQKGYLVGLEQRQEAAARGVGQHNEFVDALRDFAARVKVVEVAIDRLHSGVSADMTTLSHRMMQIEAQAMKATEAALNASQQQHQGTLNPTVAREVEAIAANAANSAVGRAVEQVHRRCERLDDAVQQLRQQDELLQRRSQVCEAEVGSIRKTADKALEDAGRAAQVASSAAASAASNPVVTAPQPAATSPQVTSKLAELEAAVVQVHSQQGQLNAALTTISEDVRKLQRSAAAATANADTAVLAPSTSAAAASVDAAAVAKNRDDIKDLRSRVQQLELQGAGIQQLIDSDVAREASIHELDLRVDALEAQVHAVRATASASAGNLARQGSRAM